MDVTAVIINYQTPDYLRTAVQSFKQFYPKTPLLIIDNGSKDDSREVIAQLLDSFEHLDTKLLNENIFHGPAMDLAARSLVETDFIFFLDSDTETLQGNFLEEMALSFIQDKNLYGVGELNHVNKRGFQGGKKEVTILQTPFMLLDREKYLSLTPFVHHGQPTLFNFKEAEKKGYTLHSFPVSDFIYHKWRGTADRFGYGLGFKGKLDFVLNKLGI